MEAIAITDILQCNLGLCIRFSQFQACISAPHPPPPLLGHLSSCRPRHWEFVRRPLPRGGAFAILLGAINIVPFPIFHLKYASLDS